MSSYEMITPRQARAARCLLGWTQQRLAKAARLGPRTVMDFESEARETSAGTRALIAMTLERNGLVLLEGEGVAFRQKAA